MDLILAAISPVMIVLVEALKRAGVPTRWLPLVAIGGGAALGAVYALATGSAGSAGPSGILTSILGGVLAGGSAAGIYDAAKSVAKETKEEA